MTVEGRKGKGEQTSFTLPSVQLWNAIEHAVKQQGAIPQFYEKRQAVLKAYFTTEASLADLRPFAGLTSRDGVRRYLRRSMRIVFPYLPPQVQAEYHTPEQAFRTRSGIRTPTSIERMRQSIGHGVVVEGEKVEFSKDHKTHLSEAASRRWQREREARRALQVGEEE